MGWPPGPFGGECEHAGVQGREYPVWRGCCGGRPEGGGVQHVEVGAHGGHWRAEAVAADILGEAGVAVPQAEQEASGECLLKGALCGGGRHRVTRVDIGAAGCHYDPPGL